MKHVLLDENRSIVDTRNARFPNSVEAPDSAVCGMVWHSKDDVRAPEPSAPEPRRVGEFREFMALFTDQEQVALVGAAMSNVQLKIWYDKAMGGATFSLDNPETSIGIGFLVQAGLLTKARAGEVLGADFDA